MLKFLPHLTNSENTVSEAQLLKQVLQKSGAQPKAKIFADNIYAEDIYAENI